MHFLAFASRHLFEAFLISLLCFGILLMTSIKPFYLQLCKRLLKIKLLTISCFHAPWTSFELHWGFEPLSYTPRLLLHMSVLPHSELT